MVVPNVAALLKSRPPASIEAGATVREAAEVMASLDVGGLAVLSGDSVAGVLSERDIVRRCVCTGRSPQDTTVTDIMTSEPHTIQADGALAEALEIMSRGRFHHVPVLDGATLVGMLFIDDIPDEYRMLLERFKAMRGG